MPESLFEKFPSFGMSGNGNDGVVVGEDAGSGVRS